MSFCIDSVGAGLSIFGFGKGKSYAGYFGHRVDEKGGQCCARCGLYYGEFIKAMRLDKL